MGMTWLYAWASMVNAVAETELLGYKGLMSYVV